jgi:hypothetical protein
MNGYVTHGHVIRLRHTSPLPPTVVAVTVVPVRMTRDADHGCASDGRASGGDLGVPVTVVPVMVVPVRVIRGASHDYASDGRAGNSDSWCR